MHTSYRVLASASHLSSPFIFFVSTKLRDHEVVIKIIGSSAYEEPNGLGLFMVIRKSSPVKWTFFRVSFLTNGEAKPVPATHAGTGTDGLLLSRKSIQLTETIFRHVRVHNSLVVCLEHQVHHFDGCPHDLLVGFDGRCN